MSLEIHAFQWPMGDGSDPQRIISTYGEFRVSSGGYPTNHFHDGVDIQTLTSDTTIWGVRWQAELVWKKTTNGVRTDYHDFAHIEDINPYIKEDSTVYMWTIIADRYQASWNHLHFCVREYREHATTAGNPLNPDFNADWRLEPLYDDTDDPEIDNIFVTRDENYSDVLNPLELPANTAFDIIVKAKENTTNSDGSDPNNGVFKVMYDITYPGNIPYYTTAFEFSYRPDYWDIDYVYDSTRSNNSNFYYVVTNGEWYNDFWSPWEGEEYRIHVRVEDEQGNFDEDSLDVYVTIGSGVDEEKPDKFALFVKSLNAPSQATEIRYSLPKKSKVNLNIYDSMGRVVNSLVNKEQKAGIYTVKWNGENKLNNILPNGIYFCNLRAGDFEAHKKIVMLTY